MMRRRSHRANVMVRALFIALALGSAALEAGAAEPPTYEPSYRYRLRSQSCLKDEAQFGARCVRPCESGYRMEQQAGLPICRRSRS